jgi:hypothetical protein
MIALMIEEREERAMDETKYGKYITRDCTRVPKPDRAPIYSTRHIAGWGAGNFSIDCDYETEPHVMVPEPHSHEFDQYLCFFGTNPDDRQDFGGEIEIYLGEEHEKHIINSPSVIWVAAGLKHGPVIYTKITKPVLFVDIAMTNNYIRTVRDNKSRE